jgi:hypothetical protein
VLLGQLEEAGLAGLPPVDLLVRVEMGRGPAGQRHELVELAAQLASAHLRVVELHQALGLVREIHVQA